jgi:hypothetical protein
MGSRDGDQLFIEHADEAEHIVALVLERDAHRANATGVLGLTERQFRDDEVEQHLARGQGRAGQCQNVMAQPLGERADVAGEAGRPNLSQPHELQLDDKLAVWTMRSRAAEPGLKRLSA